MTRRTSPALYEDRTETWGLVEADSLSLLAKMPSASVDAIVTDPPYGIGFHDEAWDEADIYAAVQDGVQRSAGQTFERWTTEWARQCARVLKPGGYMLAFSAPRRFHRLVSGVEDAGLEVRDQLLWLNGQGMPKSRRVPGGLGTTLKPAYEPILLARKPFDGRVLDNLDAFGTSALNVDACRIHATGPTTSYWPSNVALSHAPRCTPVRCADDCPRTTIDASVSRLFLCAKATRAEREAGCEHLPARTAQVYTGNHHPARVVRNSHPTVKPIELMRWLVRLVTPPGGLVLDPFAGSGTTGIAAVLEDRHFLGIEREAASVDIACARISHWASGLT
jgi:site-specific DNA-methyltransferase (adenine-specific)